MKFGRRLLDEAEEGFERYYIAYKDLKRAIKLITGTDTSQFTISEVTSNFGNIPALAGSSYRPPESRFQDLLNHEVNKINTFSALIYAAIASSLRVILKRAYHSVNAATVRGGDGDFSLNLDGPARASIDANDSAALVPASCASLTLAEWRELREAAQSAGNAVVFLHSYVRLNLTGFRKITKKYDKNNRSNAAPFYLARLVKEPFVNLNFDFLAELVSVTFAELRRARSHVVNGSNALSSPPATLSLAPSAHEGPVPTPSHIGVTLASPAEAAPARPFAHLRDGKGPYARALGMDAEDDDEDEDDGDDDVGVEAASANDREMKMAMAGMDDSEPNGSDGGNSALEVRSRSNTVDASHSDRGLHQLPPHKDSIVLTNVSDVPCESTTYLVGEDDLMRVRVCLAQYLPMRTRGGACGNRDGVAAFIENGVPGHHQVGSHMKEVIPSSLDDALALISRLMKLYDADSLTTADRGDAGGERHFLAPAVYRNDAARYSVGCAYFDTPDFAVYNRAMHGPKAQHATVLRLRWDANVEGSGGVAILEFVRAFLPADSVAEWLDLPTETVGSDAVLIHRLQLPLLVSGKATAAELVAGLPKTSHPTAVDVIEKALAVINGPQQQRPMFAHWMQRTNYRKNAGDLITKATSGTASSLYAYLDENVRFVDARPLLQDVDLFWSPPYMSLATAAEVHTPPYGLLSLSIARNGVRPAFLSRLTGLTTVAEVYRYAPLLHGVAVFRKIGKSNQPRWLSFVTATEEEEQQEERTGNDAWGTRGSLPVRVDIACGKTFVHEDTAKAVGANANAVATDTSAPMNSICPAPVSAGGAVGVNLGSPVVLTSSYYSVNTPPRAHSTARTPLLGGSSTAQSTTTEVPAPGAGVGTSVFNAVIGYVCGLAAEAGNWLWPSRAPPAVVGSAAVRVEPKTFFANERTFLQWMNTAVLLSTIAITLLNFGTSTGRLAGLIMAPVALFFIGYAFIVYLRRCRALEKKEPINYNDRVGPAVLVTCLIAAVSAIIGLNIRAANAESASVVPSSLAAVSVSPAVPRHFQHLSELRSLIEKLDADFAGSSSPTPASGDDTFGPTETVTIVPPTAGHVAGLSSTFASSVGEATSDLFVRSDEFLARGAFRGAGGQTSDEVAGPTL